MSTIYVNSQWSGANYSAGTDLGEGRILGENAFGSFAEAYAAALEGDTISVAGSADLVSGTWNRDLNVVVDPGSTLTGRNGADTTFTKGSFTIEAGGTLTGTPGNNFYFKDGESFTMNGTAENSAVFDGYIEEQGSFIDLHTRFGGSFAAEYATITCGMFYSNATGATVSDSSIDAALTVYWQNITVTNSDIEIRGVQYGSYTGANFQAGTKLVNSTLNSGTGWQRSDAATVDTLNGLTLQNSTARFYGAAADVVKSLTVTGNTQVTFDGGAEITRMSVSESQVTLSGTSEVKNTLSIAKGSSVKISSLANSGTITLSDSTLEAEELNNTNAFNVTGNSTLNIGSLTGEAALTGSLANSNLASGSVNAYSDSTIKDSFIDSVTVMEGTTAIEGSVKVNNIGTNFGSSNITISSGAVLQVGQGASSREEWLNGTGSGGVVGDIWLRYADEEGEESSVMTIENGGTLILYGQLSNRSSMVLQGTMSVEALQGTGSVALAGVASHAGTFLIDGGTFTDTASPWTSANDLKPVNSLTVGENTSGANGVLQIQNNGTFSTTESFLTVHAKGELRINNGTFEMVFPSNNQGSGILWEDVKPAASLINRGLVTVTDSLFTVDSLLNDGGTFEVGGRSTVKTAVTGDLNFLDGAILAEGSQITVSGNVTASGDLAVSVGSVSASGSFTVAGNLAFTDVGLPDGKGTTLVYSGNISYSTLTINNSNVVDGTIVVNNAKYQVESVSGITLSLSESPEVTPVTFTVNSVTQGAGDYAFTFDITASGGDGNYTCSVTAADLEGKEIAGSFEGNVFTFAAPAESTPAVFTVTVSDSYGASTAVSRTVTAPVKDVTAPEFEAGLADITLAASENGIYNTLIFDFAKGTFATDNFAVAGYVITVGDQQITWLKPDENYTFTTETTGVYSCSVTAFDAAGNSVTSGERNFELYAGMEISETGIVRNAGTYAFTVNADVSNGFGDEYTYNILSVTTSSGREVEFTSAGLAFTLDEMPPALAGESLTVTVEVTDAQGNRATFSESTKIVDKGSDERKSIYINADYSLRNTPQSFNGEELIYGENAFSSVGAAQAALGTSEEYAFVMTGSKNSFDGSEDFSLLSSVAGATASTVTQKGGTVTRLDSKGSLALSGTEASDTVFSSFKNVTLNMDSTVGTVEGGSFFLSESEKTGTSGRYTVSEGSYKYRTASGGQITLTSGQAGSVVNYGKAVLAMNGTAAFLRNESYRMDRRYKNTASADTLSRSVSSTVTGKGEGSAALTGRSAVTGSVSGFAAVKITDSTAGAVNFSVNGEAFGTVKELLKVSTSRNGTVTAGFEESFTASSGGTLTVVSRDSFSTVGSVTGAAMVTLDNGRAQDITNNALRKRSARYEEIFDSIETYGDFEGGKMNFDTAEAALISSYEKYAASGSVTLKNGSAAGDIANYDKVSAIGSGSVGSITALSVNVTDTVSGSYTKEVKSVKGGYTTTEETRSASSVELAGFTANAISGYGRVTLEDALVTGDIDLGEVGKMVTAADGSVTATYKKGGSFKGEKSRIEGDVLNYNTVSLEGSYVAGDIRNTFIVKSVVTASGDVRIENKLSGTLRMEEGSFVDGMVSHYKEVDLSSSGINALVNVSKVTAGRGVSSVGSFTGSSGNDQFTVSKGAVVTLGSAGFGEGKDKLTVSGTLILGSAAVTSLESVAGKGEIAATSDIFSEVVSNLSGKGFKGSCVNLGSTAVNFRGSEAELADNTAAAAAGWEGDAPVAGWLGEGVDSVDYLRFTAEKGALLTISGAFQTGEVSVNGSELEFNEGTASVALDAGWEYLIKLEYTGNDSLSYTAVLS